MDDFLWQTSSSDDHRPICDGSPTNVPLEEYGISDRDRYILQQAMEAAFYRARDEYYSSFLPDLPLEPLGVDWRREGF